MGPLVVALELALVGLILALLNARDHRRARAIAAVLGACPAAWRGAIGLHLHAHAPLLSRRVQVTLNVTDGGAADCWKVMRALADALPHDASLVVGTRLDPGRAVDVSVCARRRYRAASGAPRGA